MKNLLTRGRNLAVPVLLAGPAFAFAQSLGQPAGELWIGRPLELTVPARFASDDSRDTCVQAEVFYGDTHLRPEQVTATLIGTDRVRIRAERIVDEPVVRVALRAGCSSSVTRSYTLLPDMPSEAVLARLLETPGAAQVALAAAASATAGAPARSLPTALTGPRLRMTPVVAREPAAARVRAAKAFRPPEPAPARPRLRVEAMDALEADAHTLLRVSAQLSQPLDAGRRATAALLWQAISADPQDLMRSTAALEKLERDLAQLRQSAVRTRADMESLRQRLDEVRPWYQSPRAIEVLALLVLAAAAATAVFAWRSRRAAATAPWYSATDPAVLEPAAQPVEPAAAVAREMTPQAGERGEAAETAPSLDVPAPARFTSPQPAPAVASARRDPAAPAELPALELDFPPLLAASMPERRVVSGLLRVETLAATLEEADFLSSLGLQFDAMDVLKAYLEDSASPAPVAFLELMRLCAQAEDPAAVEAVQRRYAQVHGVPAPRLEQVTAPFGAESNAELAGRLARAWGTDEATSLIEQALFDPAPPAAALTLQAARDLMYLYDLALVLEAEAGTEGPAAEAHPLAPWAHAEDAHEAHAAAQSCADDSGGHRFAVDIDITAAPAPLPEQPREADPQGAAVRLLAEKEAAREAARQAARAAAEAQARAEAEAEAAFSAAVASERAISRY